jgi:hypothetical protein
MPSRKRKQAKARQAKVSGVAPKTRQATEPAVEYGSASCPHRDLTKDWAPDDYAACEEILSNMDIKTNFSASAVAAFKANPEMKNPFIELFRQVVCFYQSDNCSNERKQIFRELVLAEGTEVVRSVANTTDLTKEQTICEALPFVILLATVEELEKREWWHKKNDTFHEISTIVDDIIACPRNIVRLFHRRNKCDCLKMIYYKLKDETERTAMCCLRECSLVKGVREMIQCEHCRLRWCSKKCCIVMERYHDSFCMSIKEAEIKKNRTLKMLSKAEAILNL